jgi:hypothetical protein
MGLIIQAGAVGLANVVKSNLGKWSELVKETRYL